MCHKCNTVNQEDENMFDFSACIEEKSVDSSFFVINNITDGQLFPTQAVAESLSERSERREPRPLLVDTANKIATFPHKSVYSLRNSIGKLLFNRFNFEKITASGEILTLPTFRVSQCTNALLPTVDLVHYQSSLDGSHGHRFGGVITCGSVWHCPVCSRKISLFRADEITYVHKELTEKHGFDAFMLTLTVSHKIDTKLDDSLDVIVKAFTYALNHRSFKQRFKGFLYLKSLEVTYGANGWHPHIHALFFMPSEFSLFSEHIKDVFYPLVHDYFKRNGFSGSYKRAVDVVRSFTAAEYLSKFGRDSDWRSGQELALALYKDTHPFSLVASNPDKFCEYAKSFHGKRQLTYSQKIKIIVPDFMSKSDDEIAVLNDKEHFNNSVFTFSKKQWRVLQKNDYLDSVLLLARNSRMSGYDALYFFINNLEDLKNE